MSSAGVVAVESYQISLRELLRRGTAAKSDGSTEPILSADDLGGGIEEIGELSRRSGSKSYAAIETACRNIFYDLLASTTIGEPAFGEVWNLFDIVSILSDLEYCEAGLVFWLVEELLDSQTIEGCRMIFDYLDSRRERITAKHFKQKNLIILRACNELLRRLSRAEDTVFCGRVFIFLFQSFPLGDRSSVNLRGEYHIENVTIFEDVRSEGIKQDNVMDIDQQEVAHRSIKVGTPFPTISAQDASAERPEAGPKSVQFEPKEEKLPEGRVDMDTLYSVFWTLQVYFSQPTKLFEEQNFQNFKSGLQSTIGKFKDVHQEQQARGSTKFPVESQRGVKRKRSGQEDELSSSFNPKYLTSRDLFELEISDLAFRRHILVQALILVDFLLSLTPKAKKKLEHTSNKSVLYSYTLNDENAGWANSVRNEIAMYLQQGSEGKFYYRMVDTVLSRDKNWVHWKAEGCPPIARDPVTAQDFAEAERNGQKACANKRIRPTAMGTLDLKFLTDDTQVDGMKKLKDPARYTVPTIDSFKAPIARDEVDMEMAKDDEEKRLTTDARASKLWRTLRIASKSKLNVFDKLDDGNNLKPLFEPDNNASKDKIDVNGAETETKDQDVKADTQDHKEGKPVVEGEGKPLLDNTIK